jgi:phosphatidylinositol glycan class B
MPRTVPGGGDVRWDHEWPVYVVMFGSLLECDGVKDLLLDKGYRPVWAGGSGLGEGRRKGKVHVWKYSLP